MDVKTLVSLGLNTTQAKVYILLIKSGSMTPPALASKMDITRTNAYAVLDQLVDLGLATKKDESKKVIYRVENPIALERLAKDARKNALEHEKKVQIAMPTLLNYFHTFSDQPGIRFFQGVEGIEEIYNDTLRTARDVYVVRSPHDQDLMTVDFYNSYKEKRAKKGIKTYMLNTSTDNAVWNQKNDERYNIDRTTIQKSDYKSHVEISSYGDKTSIISFGEEAIGMIIESPQVAKAMKELFLLAKRGAQ